MAYVESFWYPEGIKNAAFVCFCLLAKRFFRNDSLTSEECKTDNRLLKGDM